MPRTSRLLLCITIIAASGVPALVASARASTPARSTVGSAASIADPCRLDVPGALHTADFEHHAVGPYDVTEMRTDWSTQWNFGVAEGRAEIIDRAGCRALRVHYPEGQVGPRTNGASWQHNLGDDFDELWLRYDIRFGEGFQFRAGGKLPGFFGGARNTGGAAPGPDEGFSARLMWREDGQMTTYLYHPDQPRNWGEYYWWRGEEVAVNESGPGSGQVVFRPGTWYSVEQRVRLNTPGLRDGIVEQWVDGELALRVTGLQFRLSDSWGIDGLYFNTFFGGQNDTYRTVRDEVVDFDHFVISTSRTQTQTQPPTQPPGEGGSDDQPTMATATDAAVRARLEDSDS